MEYMIVRFPLRRAVIINGVQQGRTNIMIELEAGTHTVTLGPPADFIPDTMTVELKDTDPLAPLTVTFNIV